MDKFTCTESDNINEEYKYADLITIHRKYVAQLNNEEFIDFIETFNGCCYTCNTMGSLTEMGHLPAFCIEQNSDNIENIYVSVLFEDDLENEEMKKIDDEIRELIESGDLTLDYLNKL